MPQQIRNLCLVFGDQLNLDSLVWQNFEPNKDAILMAEVVDESEQIPSSKSRTALFFSAMRHFAAELKAKKWPLHYFDINYTKQYELNGLADVLLHFIDNSGLKIEQIIAVLPGDSRLLGTFNQLSENRELNIRWLADNHFLAEPGEFKNWLSQRKKPIMEHWYRSIRKKLHLLMDDNGQPEGGEWNYDKSNRKNFGKAGPPESIEIKPFSLDKITTQVIDDISNHFSLPGEFAVEYWPVTREQALEVLADFIATKLALFGDYQDAMWTNEPWLYHSRIASALNLKLLSPLEVCRAVEQAYYDGNASINAVEGFIRQVIGWREYIRGLYWSHHNDWLQMNALDANHDLPEFYWTAETDMQCLHQSIKQVLDFGYGHHIQRLMVTGLFALLYGVIPDQVHRWYLAMYVDAIAWVEVPNTIGMSQFADGGIVGTKPYIASGAYIDRMSNYCKSCPYNPKLATGKNACPFTSLYWQFIDDHQGLLSSNPRLKMQLNHWLRKTDEDREAIITTAKLYRKSFIEAKRV